MDPEATLRWCREAIAERDFALATDRLFDYYRWRMGGGAAPYMGDATATKCENEILCGVENWGEISRSVAEVN
jgi:hypothetical protein